jgi:heat shock protein HspQ
MTSSDTTNPVELPAQVQKTPVFCIGDIVRHRHYPFRGVIVDVDPEFDNTEEWYNAIPEDVRPSKEQPFYHLLAENAETYYSAYVSQQNLTSDTEGGPVGHPDVEDLFESLENGRYQLRREAFN